MRVLHAALILSAALSTLYAITCFLMGLEPDSYVAATTAVAALCGALLVDYLESESRRRMVAGRERVWARREREARMDTFARWDRDEYTA